MVGWRKAARSRFRPQKRRFEGGSSWEDGIEMKEMFSQALTLQDAPCTFDMDEVVDRAELAAALWSSDALLDEGSLTASNGALAGVLEVLLRKCGAQPGEEADAAELRTAIRIEGLITNLQRAQSQKKMAILTARISLAAARCQLHGMMWQMMSLLSPGLLASETWTIDMMEFARDHRPPCDYEELPLVGGAMFDNYTRRVLYKSLVTVEKSGFLLNMTNWASFTIPKLLVGPNFDPHLLCELVLDLMPAYARIDRMHPVCILTCVLVLVLCCVCVLQGETPSGRCRWVASPPSF